MISPTEKTAWRVFAYNMCMSGYAAGPVLYAGAATRMMDGACISQVIYIFTVVTKLQREPSYTVPPPFSWSHIKPCQKTSNVAFLWSLAFRAQRKERRDLCVFSPCSTHPSSAQWSTFPAECSSAIHLFLPPPHPSTLLYLPPHCDGFMLRCTFRLCVGWCCGPASGSLW